MKLRKKLTKTSTGSYMIVIPKTWIDNLTKETGKEPKEIMMDINTKIIIEPVLEVKK